MKHMNKLALLALGLASAAAAQEVTAPASPTTDALLRGVAMAAMFSAIGLAFFGAAFLIMAKVAPFSIRKEIEEDHNTALAIVLASVILGIAIIVAASIHG